MADHMEAVKNAVIGGKHAEIKALVTQALDAGLDPNTIINDALIAAMDVVGTDFGSGKIFVPEMLVAALTMKSGLDIVKPRLAAGQGQSRGTSARTWFP
jgi:5-methyltetrahydrofolate--homocysteine methyltransferase